jgi:hypothetical protein
LAEIDTLRAGAELAAGEHTGATSHDIPGLRAPRLGAGYV